VKGLKDRHYYTDTASFDLRCGVCGEGLKGEKGAREHAMSTGRESVANVPGVKANGQMSSLVNTSRSNLAYVIQSTSSCSGVESKYLYLNMSLWTCTHA